MKFEQYQAEDGKNIINIRIEKEDDADAIFKNGKQEENKTENQIKPKEELKEIEYQKIEEIKPDDNEKFIKYKKYLMIGILSTLILLVVLIILYLKGV